MDLFGALGAGLERGEPGGPPRPMAQRLSGYQLPLAGQPPLPVGVHVRVTTPELPFTIRKEFPDCEWAVTV